MYNRFDLVGYTVFHLQWECPGGVGCQAALCLGARTAKEESSGFFANTFLSGALQMHPVVMGFIAGSHREN